MDYPNRGTLWKNKYKKSDAQPDLKGDIKIELELMKELMREAESDHVVIKLDGWVSKDNDGNRKVGLKVNTYKKPETFSGKDPWDD